MVVIHQEEHPDFKRKGADLFLARDVGLLEALTGFRMASWFSEDAYILLSTLVGLRSGTLHQPRAEVSLMVTPHANV